MLSDIKSHVTRPASFFTTEPIIIALGIYLVIIYVLNFMFLNGFEFIFTNTYDLSPGLTNTAFVGITIGAFLSTLTSPLFWLNNKNKTSFQSKTLRSNARDTEAYAFKSEPPEIRLWPSIVLAPFLAISLFWLGWTNYPSINPLVGYGATILFGFALTSIFVSSYQYIIQSYGSAASSALGSITLVRYTVSGAMIIATRPTYQGIGVHWTLTLLGIIATVLVPVPYMIYKYGPKLREKSKFAEE